MLRVPFVMLAEVMGLYIHMLLMGFFMVEAGATQLAPLGQNPFGAAAAAEVVVPGLGERHLLEEMEALEPAQQVESPEPSPAALGVGQLLEPHLVLVPLAKPS